jgi:hypothetical protein
VISLLRAAPPVLREGERDLPAITAFAKALTPFSKNALAAAQQLVPAINGAAQFKNQITLGMVDLAAILNSTSSANTTSDALGIPAGQANTLRQEITLGADTLFGQTTRSAAVRSNAYPSASALAQIGSASGEPAESCAGAGAGNVPCVTQPSFPYTDGIGTSYYPRLKKAAP